MHLEGEIIELHNFHGYYEQRWNVIHVEDMYYKIISQYSDLALTAPTGPNNDVVTQTTYTGDRTHLWKFIERSDGTYKISPKSNSNYFMAAGDISSTADQDLEIRNAQSDGGDKWYIRRYNGNIQLEAQQQNNWCWVACARMFTMKFFDPLMSQASAAVYVKLNTVTHNPTTLQIQQANLAGTLEEIEKAIEYLSGVSFTYSASNKIYSEYTLRSLLDQSNLVIACRAEYTDGVRQTGHAVVIYGYHWDANESMYVYDILDPSPVNGGSSYVRSYKNICNGTDHEYSADPTNDFKIWDKIVVYRFGSYDNTIDAFAS